MTSLDILEALGQIEEELLNGCDGVIRAPKVGEDDIATTDNEDKADAQNLSDHKNRKIRQKIISGPKLKYRRAAAGLLAAAAALLLLFVGSGAYIRRNFDSGNSGNSQSTSTAETAEISADTAMDESVVEESAEEEAAEEETAVGESESVMTEAEEAQTEAGAKTEALALETLQLGEVYIPGFATSSLSDSEYAEWMELVALVQAEIDDALSQEMYETLPVYRFVRAEEFASDLPERLGDYPVITAEEAEELLMQGYYLAVTGFSEEAADSVEVASVELQYLICAGSQIYMPYYQFTVVADGDMVYICCVPAVSSEYLEGTLNGGVAE